MALASVIADTKSTLVLFIGHCAIYRSSVLMAAHQTPKGVGPGNRGKQIDLKAGVAEDG